MCPRNYLFNTWTMQLSSRATGGRAASAPTIENSKTNNESVSGTGTSINEKFVYLFGGFSWSSSNTLSSSNKFSIVHGVDLPPLTPSKIFLLFSILSLLFVVVAVVLHLTSFLIPCVVWLTTPLTFRPAVITAVT